MNGTTAESWPTLKVGTVWTEIEIVGEPSVKVSFKGYAPILPVRVLKTGLEYVMYIGAKSLADGIEPLRKANEGKFSGLKLRIKKQSEDKFSQYSIELV